MNILSKTYGNFAYFFEKMLKKIMICTRKEYLPCENFTIRHRRNLGNVGKMFKIFFPLWYDQFTINLKEIEMIVIVNFIENRFLMKQISIIYSKPRL